MHVVEHYLGGVRGADAVLLELLALGQALGAGRYDERHLAAGAERRVDRRDDDVPVGDAAVRGPGLGAVEHPLVVGLVVDRASLHRADVATGVGLGGAERTELRVVRRAVHRGDELPDLLVGAVRADRGRCEPGAHDRQRDAGVAPEQLLLRDDHAETGVVEPLLSHEVDRVDPDLGRLLDDRPGRLLALVPLVGRGADHIGGEVVQPLLQRDLVLGEVQGELGHGVLLQLRAARCGPVPFGCCHHGVTGGNLCQVGRLVGSR